MSPQEARRELYATLRSGEWTQIFHSVGTMGTREACAYGVALVVFHRNGGALQPNPHHIRYPQDGLQVLEFYGWPAALTDEIFTMNDDLRLSFNEIATQLEKQFND